MAWSKVCAFADPFQYTSAVRAADMQVFPTARGEFRAKLTQVTMNQLWMQRFTENLARIHKGATRPGRRIFSFLTEDQPEVRNRGRLQSLGELCVEDCEMQHVATSGHYRVAAMSLKPEELAAASKAIFGREFYDERDARFIRPNPPLMERLLKLHKAVGGVAETTPELFAFPEVVRALEQELIHALVRCLPENHS